MDDLLEASLQALLKKMWATMDTISDARRVFTEVECEMRLRPPAVHARHSVDSIASRLCSLKGWKVTSDSTFRQARCSCKLHRVRIHGGSSDVEVVLKEPAAMTQTWSFGSGWTARVALSTETRFPVSELPCLTKMTYEGHRRRVSLCDAHGIRADLTVPDFADNTTWIELEIQEVSSRCTEVAVDYVQSALVDVMECVALG